MTDDLKVPERTMSMYLSKEDMLRDRIATLEAELADMTQQRDAAMAGVVKVKPLVWQDFANIEAGPVGLHGDNLAVALCSYFDRHMSCPDDGEDGSELDEYDCWKVWVSENAEDVLRRIAQAANARILSALTPDPDRMLALTAAAEAQAEARGMRKAAEVADKFDGNGIPAAFWPHEISRTIRALADATEAAASGAEHAQPVGTKSQPGEASASSAQAHIEGAK